MGLFMDSMGFPITYRLFDGNTNDCETLIPILRNMKLNCNIGRTIVVADKGMNISNNIIFNLINKDGYVYSQTVRGGHKELKEYVLDEKNYQWINKNYKIKSRIYPRIVYVNDINGKKKKIRIDEKQVVFYNRDYDKKAKADREAAIIKARDMANNPSKYNKQTSYGAAKYVKNITFDKETGEIVTIGNKPVFDEEKLQNEEKFDGYYAIVTSEYKKTGNEIIEIYRRLWKIEESFKVTKSDFKSRPVYVSREDHIQSHFLICFIALVIARLLEHRLDNIHSIKQIASSLNKVSCSPLEENWYIFDYKDDITEAISKKLGIDMNRKYLRLGDIKKILGNTKI
jgi:transposase